ncbi:hypothetical protein BPY_09220 [Bifidobacterium psychraerophilum]
MRKLLEHDTGKSAPEKDGIILDWSGWKRGDYVHSDSTEISKYFEEFSKKVYKYCNNNTDIVLDSNTFKNESLYRALLKAGAN